MISLTAIVFIVIFLSGCFAALFIGPAYGIYLYIFQYFLNPPGRWWWGELPPQRFALIVGMVVLIGYLLRSKRYSENKIFDYPQSKWLLLFGILMILTWPIAIDKTIHTQYMILVTKYLCLYFLIIKVIDTPKNYERMIWVFLLGQFYLGWLAFGTGRTYHGRLEGLGGSDSRDSNMTAAVMIVAIPILINYLITGKKWQKLCAIPILIFVLNAIILLNSRGAFVAIVISLAYYFVLTMKAQVLRSKRFMIIFGATIIIVIFIYVADPFFWERMSTLIYPDKVGDTGRDRTYFWLATFDMLKDHPFGVGARGYEILSPQYLPPESLTSDTPLGQYTNVRAVHSMFFQVLAEYGYHGFILFMVFLYSVFRYSRKLRKSFSQIKLSEYYSKTIALEAGFLAFLITGVFISSLYLEVMFWISAFFASLGNICIKEKKKLIDNVDKEDKST